SDRQRLTASLGGSALQFGYLRLECPFWQANGSRAPPVRVFDDAREVAVATANQDWRMRSLDRLRPRHQRGEVDELAMKLGFVLRPDHLHRGHPLSHQAPAALGIGAVIAHLGLVPSATDAEDE